jgi:RND superfamily putative drug exporter
MNTVVNEEFGMILMIALLAGFIILLLAFGSVVAALVPLALALASIFAAVGAATVVSRFQPLNIYYYEMIVLLGLAVGIDYSLFVINRFRESREVGMPKLDAIRFASGTAGRAVFYAGVIVVVSVAGLLITMDPLFIGLGLGAMIVVFFSLIASLTLLPALLSLLGDNVNRLRIRGLGRPSRGGGIWGFITDRVLRRPAIFATVTLVLLIALAVPLLSLHMGNTPITTDTIPEKLEGYRALELLEDHFGGLSEMSALVVAVDPGEGGNVDTPEIRASVEILIEDLEHDSSFVAPFHTQVNQDGDLLLISVPVVDPDDEDKAEEAVKEMRDDFIPAAFQTNGVDVLVGGGASYSVDARDNVKSTAPAVFAFVLGLAFVLLLVMFRSIVIPIKAIVLNLISVGAAYGVLILVFQEGVGDSLLNFKAVGIIEIFMPLFLFAVLFGLSMDYHMLVLSRIKEAYDSGRSNEESVSVGIKTTAAMITSAAAIMVLVFGAFSLSSAMFMKQMGVGLGVAILIDATLIRVVLLPASMKLLGDKNWYLPKWLEWLPRISPEVKHKA